MLMVMKKTLPVLLAMISLICGIGCAKVDSPVSRSPFNSKLKGDEVSASLDLDFSWSELQEGVARGEQSKLKDGWRHRVIVYRFDPAVASFHLENAQEGKTIRAWRDDLPRASFIINGVYFNEDATPTGSLRIDGIEQSSSTFDEDKSGVFEFDGDPSILDTSGNPALVTSASVSAQSYPFLIKNGTASVAKDSGQLARRSFIGTDMDGLVYLGAYTDGEISLYDLSRLLETLPVDWKYVLNLDGGTSTTFYSGLLPLPEIEDGYSAVPNVIWVEMK